MVERNRRTLRRKRKHQVLERDSYSCAYCTELAAYVDHVLPWSYEHNNDMTNLVAACFLCNSIASNKVFDGFQKKQAHILEIRSKMKKCVVGIWLIEELDGLGYGLRSAVESSALVVESVADAVKLQATLKEMGIRSRWRR